MSLQYINLKHNLQALCKDIDSCTMMMKLLSAERCKTCAKIISAFKSHILFPQRTKGSPNIKKNGKKGHIVPFRQPGLLNGQKGHICCLKKVRKSRQMRFLDKTAYV